MKVIVLRSLRLAVILTVVFTMVSMTVIGDLSFSAYAEDDECDESEEVLTDGCMTLSAAGDDAGTEDQSGEAGADTQTQTDGSDPAAVTPAVQTPAPKVVKPPSKITIKSIVSKKEKQVLIKWKKTSCTRYQINYARDKNFKKSAGTINVSKKKTQYTFKNLAKGKRYYFRIRAQKDVKEGKKAKKKKLNGQWSAVRSIVVHKHKFKIVEHLKPASGVQYTVRYKCSCGSSYYRSKTKSGKLYNGIIIRMPSCIQGELKATPNSRSKYIPATTTHVYTEVNGKKVCKRCGQLLNYIDTEYVIDAVNNISRNTEFTAPKNTNLSSSVALSVKNRMGEQYNYKLYYQKSTSLVYQYPKYKKYLSAHGCSTCALTTVLNATVPKYKNYTPDMVIEKVIRPAVGEKAFKANFKKSLKKQMPIGLKGIAKVLKANGVQYKYVHEYTKASAKAEIQAHLESGNPVIFTMPKSVYCGGIHTMCMLGLDTNNSIIVGDSLLSSSKKWGKYNRLVKYNRKTSTSSTKVKNVVKYFKSSTKDVSKVKPFYSGKKGNIGYILVWKGEKEPEPEPQPQPQPVDPTQPDDSQPAA